MVEVEASGGLDGQSVGRHDQEGNAAGNLPEDQDSVEGDGVRRVAIVVVRAEGDDLEDVGKGISIVLRDEMAGDMLACQ